MPETLGVMRGGRNGDDASQASWAHRSIGDSEQATRNGPTPSQKAIGIEKGDKKGIKGQSMGTREMGSTGRHLKGDDF